MEFKEHNPKILWVAKEWKRWQREYKWVQMYSTKKECEREQGCKAVKIRVFID